ncbi:hypothetical protein D3C78_1031420 [compost metagenome]
MLWKNNPPLFQAIVIMLPTLNSMKDAIIGTIINHNITIFLISNTLISIIVDNSGARVDQITMYSCPDIRGNTIPILVIFVISPPNPIYD